MIILICRFDQFINCINYKINLGLEVNIQNITTIMELRVGNKYQLSRKLGSGAFGDIYHGINIETNQEVAIKLELVRSSHPQLLYETKIYRVL